MTIVRRLDQTHFQSSITRNISKFHSVAKKGNILGVTAGCYINMEPYRNRNQLNKGSRFCARTYFLFLPESCLLKHGVLRYRAIKTGFGD